MTHEDVFKTEHFIYADIIRICSIIAVVTLHVSAGIVGSYNNIGLFGWWTGNIANSISRWGVPCLTMLAGALLLEPKKVESASLFFRKRAKRIVVPMLSWFLLYFLWLYFGHGQSINLEFIVKRIILGGPSYHLYFLYVIATLYLVTPALRTYISRANFLKRAKLTIIFFSLGFSDSFIFYYLYCHPGWYDSISSFFPLFGFTFGFVGYFLAGYELRMMTFSRKALNFALVGFLLSLIITSVGTYILVKHFGLSTFGLYFYDSFSPTCLVMSLCIFIILKEEHRLADIICKNETIYNFVKYWAAPGTFGIYLVHPIFIDILWKYMNITGNRGNAIIHLPPWLGIPFLSVVVIVFSFIATLFIQRIPYLKRIVGYW
jgi:surface polysaccharide O-acyltransferase-like enzyme